MYILGSGVPPQTTKGGARQPSRLSDEKVTKASIKTKGKKQNEEERSDRFTLRCGDNDLTCFVAEIWSNQVSLYLLSPRGVQEKLKKDDLETGALTKTRTTHRNLEQDFDEKQFVVIIGRSLNHYVTAVTNIKERTHALALTRSLHRKRECTHTCADNKQLGSACVAHILHQGTVL